MSKNVIITAVVISLIASAFFLNPSAKPQD